LNSHSGGGPDLTGREAAEDPELRVQDLPAGRHLIPAVAVDTHAIVWYLSATPGRRQRRLMPSIPRRMPGNSFGAFDLPRGADLPGREGPFTRRRTWSV